MARPFSYTEEEFISAWSKANSYPELFKLLGLSTEQDRNRFRKRAEALGLSFEKITQPKKMSYGARKKISIARSKFIEEKGGGGFSDVK